MHAITHIIATTDFSAAAGRAVQRAALIAKHFNAELHLMRVVHPLDLYTSTELSFGYKIAMLLLAAIGVIMMVRKGVEAFIAVGITSTS